MKQKQFSPLVLIAAGLFLFSSAASASPNANILYNETTLENGGWQYDYTFYNTSTSGEHLYSLWFDFSQTANVTGLPLPTGWSSTGWGGVNKLYLDTFSKNSIYDISAGSSQSGFSFTINYRAGNLPYTAYFDDHTGNTYVTSGVTSIAPEPISSILFVTGGAITAIRNYLRRKK
jgi:hypothetical protein